MDTKFVESDKMKYFIYDFDMYHDFLFHEVEQFEFLCCIQRHKYYIERTTYEGQLQYDYYDKDNDFLFAYRYHYV